MSSNEIVLISSDGESFKVDEAVAREFQIVAHMIDDVCADKPIPLTNVTGQDLALVIEYCKTHVEAGISLEEGEEDKKQVPGEEDKKQVEGEEDKVAKKQVVEAENEENEAKKTALKSWDAEFMKQHNLETIFRLILAANYLNVKGLLDLLCQNVADHIKDKTPGEVRDIFGIENDYTPEEEAAILKENSWAFE